MTWIWSEEFSKLSDIKCHYNVHSSSRIVRYVMANGQMWPRVMVGVFNCFAKAYGNRHTIAKKKIITYIRLHTIQASLWPRISYYWKVREAVDRAVFEAEGARRFRSCVGCCLRNQSRAESFACSSENTSGAVPSVLQIRFLIRIHGTA
jgi:hypothetical protein